MTFGYANDAGDRRDVAEKDEIEIVVKRRTDRVRRIDQEKRVAIRLGPHDRLGGDVAAGARADSRRRIVDRAVPTDTDRSGARRCRSGHRAESRRRCAPAATDKFAPRRRRAPRRQRGSASGHMQKTTTGKFHEFLPFLPTLFAAPLAGARSRARVVARPRRGAGHPAPSCAISGIPHLV